MTRAARFLLLLLAIAAAACDRGPEPSAAKGRPPASGPVAPARQAPPPAERLTGRVIVIGFDAVVGDTVHSRSKNEAIILAAKLVDRIRRGEDFETLMNQYSDDAEGRRKGGRVALRREDVSPGPDPDEVPASQVPDLAARLFELNPGETALVPHHPDTCPTGYLVVQRRD